MVAKKTSPHRHRHKEEVKKKVKESLNPETPTEQNDNKPLPDQIPLPPTQVDSNRPGIVEVKGLPHFFIESDLKMWLGQIGEINRVHINKSKKSGRSTGRGFIEFNVDEVAQLVAKEFPASVVECYRIKLKYRPDISADPELVEKVFKYANRPQPILNKSKIGAECVVRTLNMDLEAKRNCREKFIAEIAKIINVDPSTIHRPESVTAY